jgi:hypothetical protein
MAQWSKKLSQAADYNEPFYDAGANNPNIRHADHSWGLGDDRQLPSAAPAART